MTTVKYMAEIEAPTDNTGYLVDGTLNVPFDEGNRHYKEVQVWIAEGNTVAPAFSVEELADHQISEDKNIQQSMIEEGETLTSKNNSRLNVAANPLIEDQAVFDVWIKNLYDDKDGSVIASALFKPPATERQLMSIYDEDQDNYTFTRYVDEWGYRWYLELFRADVNALAIAIYDAAGNYLYTTGGLIDTGNGSWYTECPAGQADAVPEDVYFKWLLGSASISSLELYRGAVEEKSGAVHSDERYD